MKMSTTQKANYAYSAGLEFQKTAYFEGLSEEFSSLEYDEDVENEITSYCQQINELTEVLSRRIAKIRKGKRDQTNVINLNEARR